MGRLLLFIGGLGILGCFLYILLPGPRPSVPAFFLLALAFATSLFWIGVRLTEPSLPSER